MKKKFSVYLISSLLLTLTLVGCSSTGDDVILPSLYEVKEEREIVVSELPNLEVGDLINLDDYIEIIPGDYELPTEKLDLSYTVELMTNTSGTVLERVSTNIGTTNSFRAINTGLAGLLIESNGISKEVYLYVNTSSKLQAIADFFSDWTDSNYTVVSGYEVNEEFEAVQTTKQDSLYRTATYHYDVNDKAGYFVYENVAYQYSLSDLEDESTFYPYFYESTTNRTTSSVYLNRYRTFSAIFAISNLSYNEEVAGYYGEEFGYGISSSSGFFTYLLNNLGLSSAVSLYDYSLTLNFIVPIIEGTDVSFYAYASSLRGHVLLGPITLTNIGTTSVDILEDVIANESFGSTTLDSTTIQSLGEFTSYTSKVTGNYYTEDGELYTPSDDYTKYVPNDLNLTIDITSTSLSFSTFKYIEKGRDAQVTLEYSSIDGGYIIKEDEVSLGLYEYNGSTFSDYKDVSDFAVYDMSKVFTTSNFANVLFYLGDDGVYKGTTFLNDALDTLLSSFIPLTSTNKLLSSSGPLASNSDNSYVDVVVTSNGISGVIRTEMTLDSVDLYYEYNFALSNLGYL